MKQPSVALSLVLALACASVAAGQQKMTTYQLVVLKRGPASESTSRPDGQAVMKEHVAYVYKLGSERLSMASGPVIDASGNISGLHILKLDSVEKAREVLASDPGIKAAIFTADVLPFMSTDAGMRPWAEFPQFETVYFGFLNSGQNRTQDAETAKRLQAEHLAYMNGQHQQGRLIFAGPFVDGGTHRGLVVYRAGSLDEARKWAEGDPMVKAGRLAIDLHTWQVPKGALPESRN